MVVFGVNFFYNYGFSQSGEEKGRIERPGGPATPIWSLAWSPVK